jgi:hypothetical protein
MSPIVRVFPHFTRAASADAGAASLRVFAVAVVAASATIAATASSSPAITPALLLLIPSPPWFDPNDLFDERAA